MASKKLLAAMARDTALSETAMQPDANHIEQNGPTGTEGALPEWASAMLIMNGCRAKWAVNYWVISKGSVESGISGRNNFDEWVSVINDVVARSTRHNAGGRAALGV